MLKKVVEFTDFNGEPASETLYFNLTEAEIIRLDANYPGGLKGVTTVLDPQNNPQQVLDLFEDVIRASYGEKSSDGRHFVKDPNAVQNFLHSAAYSALFMELIQDGESAAAFVNGIMISTVPEKKE
jgi:hypothetical protein